MPSGLLLKSWRAELSGWGSVIVAERTPESRRDELDTWLERLRALGAGHTSELLQIGRGVVGSSTVSAFMRRLTELVKTRASL